jgi:hypothetical protein
LADLRDIAGGIIVLPFWLPYGSRADRDLWVWYKHLTNSTVGRYDLHLSAIRQLPDGAAEDSLLSSVLNAFPLFSFEEVKPYWDVSLSDAFPTTQSE